jgi:hypothetical protein
MLVPSNSWIKIYSAIEHTETTKVPFSFHAVLPQPSLN